MGTAIMAGHESVSHIAIVVAGIHVGAGSPGYRPPVACVANLDIAWDLYTHKWKCQSAGQSLATGD